MDHTTLSCRCADRILLQAYIPKLQMVGHVCRFLHDQRGFRIPSSTGFARIGAAHIDDVQSFANDNSIPVVHF